MWLKIFVIFAGFLAVTSSGNTKKLYKPPKEYDENYEFSPLVDPIDGISYRLPNDTIGLTYDIFLSTEIHRGEFEFSGETKILIQIVENTDQITLQYRQMNINSVTLLDVNNRIIRQNVPWTQNATVEFLIIRPNFLLFAGERYFVEIHHNGIIRNDGLGWYRSSYLTPEGKRRWLATTQFQATEARSAFPCFDEPARRSLFTVSIRHHESYTALSNMPVASRTQVQNTDYVITKFDQTPSMQSYLVAFTVSDFISVENATVVPPQRIYGRRQSIRNGDGQLALEASIKLMAGFEDYLQIPYTFPKMDQFACPDFIFGAMENWGLAIYVEPLLLFNGAIDRTRDEENIKTIVSHEFAHQWFGNLVSPEWWTFLWINEGFAALYEYYLTHITYPGERFLDNFFIDYQRVALEVDANPNIRAMSHYVENPDNIESLFDIVSYHKAGSVFFMFMNAFTDLTWRKGLFNFLNDRAFNYYNADHLYSALQRAVNEDFPFNPVNVANIMRTWEFLPGFPLITVQRSENEISFHQERFFYDNRTSDSIWWVPINYASASSPNFGVTRPDFWMGTRNFQLQRQSAPKPWAATDWIVVNLQQTGYYRVNYDDSLWSSIIAQLNAPGDGFHAINSLNRAQLIDDSFHLARAGKIGFDVMMRIMNYLERDVDYVPWAMTNRANNLLNRWLTGTVVHENYRNFVLKNVDLLYGKLGVRNGLGDSRVDRYARAIAINLACQAGLPRCLNETSLELATFIRTQTPIAADLEATIYCNGVRRANLFTVAYMQYFMLTSSRPRQRNMVISGLGCIESPQILRSHLSFALEPFELSNNERSNILLSPVNNGDTSLRVMMEFIRDNYERINSFNPNQVAILCSNIAQRISSEPMYQEFVALISRMQLVGAITLNQSNAFRESARVILRWQDENLDDFIRFFSFVRSV